MASASAAHLQQQAGEGPNFRRELDAAWTGERFTAKLLRRHGTSCSAHWLFVIVSVLCMQVHHDLQISSSE